MDPALCKRICGGAVSLKVKLDPWSGGESHGGGMMVVDGGGDEERKGGGGTREAGGERCLISMGVVLMGADWEAMRDWRWG